MNAKSAFHLYRRIARWLGEHGTLTEYHRILMYVMTSNVLEAHEQLIQAAWMTR